MPADHEARQGKSSLGVDKLGLFMVVTLPVMLAQLIMSGEIGFVVLQLPASVRIPLTRWAWDHASPNGFLCRNMHLCASPSVLHTAEKLNTIYKQISEMRIAAYTSPADFVLQTYADNIERALPELKNDQVARTVATVDSRLRAIRLRGQNIRAETQEAGGAINSAINALGSASSMLALTFNAMQAEMKRNSHEIMQEGSPANVTMGKRFELVRQTLQQTDNKLLAANRAATNVVREITHIIFEIEGGQRALATMQEAVAKAQKNAGENKLTTALVATFASALSGSVGCSVGLIAGPGGCILLGSFLAGTILDDGVTKLTGIDNDRTTVKQIDQLQDSPQDMMQFLRYLQHGYETSQAAIREVRQGLAHLDELVVTMLRSNATFDVSLLDIPIGQCADLRNYAFGFNQAYLNGNKLFGKTQGDLI